MASMMKSKPFESSLEATFPPHALSASDVRASLGLEGERGWATSDIPALRERYGPNELAQQPPPPLWQKFLVQFQEMVIIILIVAALVAGLLGEWTDAVAILAIVLLNGILGFLQEQKAERALSSLRKLSAPNAKVVRDGTVQVLPAKDLVPGDRIELEAGDNVPADARLIEAFGLRVQEAALTGESVPEEKNASTILAPDTPLADHLNMVYLGTVVATGRASALVTATGMRSELGNIAGMLQRCEAETTPLQKKLAQMGRVLALVCLGIVLLVFVVELFQGGDLFEVFLLSVSLAVAAVPEGLPAVVTIALALGLRRMILRNALIRRLPSVETLGSVTVICSDKTGTLTKNEMTVRELRLRQGTFEVTGSGYTPQGGFAKRDPFIQTAPLSTDELAGDLRQALLVGVRCNNAVLQPCGKAGEAWKIVGDPTEGALLVAGLKAGIQADKPIHPILLEIPFDSERKMMTVVVREEKDGFVLYSKGAPEVVLDKCTHELRDGQIVDLTPDRRNEVLAANADMASKALRVLGLAFRPLEGKPKDPDFVEADLVFIGLAGMIDPPREEARKAVQKCHEAGIRPVMITGDHPITGSAIARELDILKGESRVVTGQELERWTDEELASQVPAVSVYARVSAQHKLRIVQAWKKNGQVVAMTGDGVNDAPALKAADIGIAMGITGTDVSKEASAMVLTDDNFASIVNAVEEGRGIYDNIQKVLLYLLSCNWGEILFVLLASLLGWPAPLLAVQLLWINLVTDGLPALALAVEPPEPGLMQRPPRSPQEGILSWRFGGLILLHGSLVGVVSLIAFGIAYNGNPENLPRARTTAFCVLVYAELLRALAARSQTLPLARLGLFTNPYLLGAIGISALLQLSIVTMPFARPVFESVRHFPGEWFLLFTLAVVPLLFIELTKWMLGPRKAA